MRKRVTTRPIPSGSLAGIKLPHPLREYQKEGVMFLLHSEAALLADEMGLGKTVQTILAIRLLKQTGACQRILIVAPRSLCKNWQEEFSRWAPNLLVRIVAGNQRDRQALYYLPIPVLIATYELIRLDSDLLDRENQFGVVVLDESQRIKDSTCSTSIACRGIPRVRSWALTGTPVENRPDDLISIFSFVRRQLICRGLSVHDMHTRIKPHFLRRTKKDVLPDLPPILVQDLHLELQGNQLAAYENLWDKRMHLPKRHARSIPASYLLALITKLKQLCNREPHSGESVKAEALNAILENLSSPTDKVLVFSQYVETLRWLATEMNCMPSKLFSGDMNDDQRQNAIRWFREPPGPRMLLVSVKAGGVGLNLQEAATVVMFDRWWNPAIEDQAIQRAHRFGRKDPLHVFRFLVRNTIEERIDALLREKKMIFREFVDNAQNADLTELPREDLFRILNLPTTSFPKHRQ